MPAPARTYKVLERAGKGWRGRGQVAECNGQESGKAAAAAGKTPGRTADAAGKTPGRTYDAAGKTPGQVVDIVEKDSPSKLALGRRAGTEVARARRRAPMP